MDWFLCDRDLRHKGVKATTKTEWAKQIADVVLVSLLLTLNRFHILFCYIVDFGQENVS